LERRAKVSTKARISGSWRALCSSAWSTVIFLSSALIPAFLLALSPASFPFSLAAARSWRSLCSLLAEEPSEYFDQGRASAASPTGRANSMTIFEVSTNVLLKCLRAFFASFSVRNLNRASARKPCQASKLHASEQCGGVGRKFFNAACAIAPIAMAQPPCIERSR